MVEAKHFIFETVRHFGRVGPFPFADWSHPTILAFGVAVPEPVPLEMFTPSTVRFLGVDVPEACCTAWELQSRRSSFWRLCSSLCSSCVASCPRCSGAGSSLSSRGAFPGLSCVPGLLWEEPFASTSFWRVPDISEWCGRLSSLWRFSFVPGRDMESVRGILRPTIPRGMERP